MDEECKHSQSLSIGMEVAIGVTKTSPESEWISGKIKRIVDREKFNEYGVFVELVEYNITGHVKKILDKDNSEEEELTEEQILEILEKIHNGSSFETTKFELKETLWYDVRKSEHAGSAIKNLKLEYVVVDEICAFLNTSGGHVLIGVTNDGVIKGITEERDLQWMGEGKKDPDHFADMISKKLEEKYFKDAATADLVRVKPMIVGGYPIIVIKIKKSFKPFFVHKKGHFKDENDFESQIDLIECVTRRETGLTKPDFPSFMETWNAKNN